jgi:hypothetical protein
MSASALIEAVETEGFGGRGVVAACPVPKLAHSRRPGVSRSLGCSVVLADQAAEDLPALDPGGDIDGAAGLAQRRFLLQALMRAVAL